jgi:hypothetical protein
MLTELAQHDPARFEPGGDFFLTQTRKPRASSTSATSDTQNAYLIDVQAHFNLGGELRNARRSARIEGQHRTCRKYSFAVLMLFERFRLSAMSHMNPDGKAQNEQCFRSSSPLQIADLLMRKAAVTGRGGLEYVGRSYCRLLRHQEIGAVPNDPRHQRPAPVGKYVQRLGMAAGFRLEGVAYRQVTMW